MSTLLGYRHQVSDRSTLPEQSGAVVRLHRPKASREIRQNTRASLIPDRQKLARVSVKSMKKAVAEQEPEIVGRVL